MKIRRLHTSMLAALLGSAALAGCGKQDAHAMAPVVAASAAVETPAAPPAATSVSSVDLGNAVGADLRVITPMTRFAPKDTLHAAVSLSVSDRMPAGKLGVKWTHMDSNQTVLEESRDIAFTGDGILDFQISKPDGWPTGRYKVEVSLDGNVVQTREFDVQ